MMKLMAEDREGSAHMFWDDDALCTHASELEELRVDRHCAGNDEKSHMLMFELEL
jgi:hypothetical protein